MIKVAIFPPWDSWLDNSMFDDAEGCVYTHAFNKWRDLAYEAGFELGTHDVIGISNADILWYMDLPRTRKSFDGTKSVCSENAISVLQLLESPLFYPAAFIEANRRHFDAIISYEYVVDKPPHFTYKLPVSCDPKLEGLDFHERRLAVMVNTNRYEGWLATRKTGMVGLPGVGACFSGWNLPLTHPLHPVEGELYSWRRCVVRSFERNHPEGLDVFGHGWNGEGVSWLPFYKTHSPCWKKEVLDNSAGARNLTKRSRLGNYRFVIASENLRGSRGYISEKIFDAMLGGSVPVYLGEENIREIIPPACFVDVRDFGHVSDLIKYLKSVEKTEWEEMREAGENYLASKYFGEFTNEVFATRMIAILKQIKLLQVRN